MNSKTLCWVRTTKKSNPKECIIYGPIYITFFKRQTVLWFDKKDNKRSLGRAMTQSRHEGASGKCTFSFVIWVTLFYHNCFVTNPSSYDLSPYLYLRDMSIKTKRKEAEKRYTVVVKCKWGLIFQPKYIPNKNFNVQNPSVQNVGFYKKTKKKSYEWKEINLTRMAITNITKTPTAPKLICKFSVIAVRFPTGLFVNLDKKIVKFLWKLNIK